MEISTVPLEKLNDRSYNSGQPDGLWKWYYEVALAEEEEYFQGQVTVLLTEYWMTGEIIAQGQYTEE